MSTSLYPSVVPDRPATRNPERQGLRLTSMCSGTTLGEILGLPPNHKLGNVKARER